MTASMLADGKTPARGAGVVDPPRLTGKRKTRLKASFEAVISMWEEEARCEVDTGGGVKCSRPARWRTDFHGCSRGLMCTEDMKAWKQKVTAAMRGGSAPCNGCQRVFASVGEAFTVTEL